MLQTLQKRKQDQSGFTIIEVLIVLAIAGLILLIVFLAVPALQRSQRNSARKSDAGRIGSAVSDFVSNNSGALPASTADLQTVYTDAGTLGQYTSLTMTTGAGTANDFALDAVTTATVTPTAAIKANALVLVTGTGAANTGYICGTGGTATQTGATPRNAALLYTVEPGGTGNWTWDCTTIQ